MVSDDTKVVAVFVVLAVILWYVSAAVTDSTIVQLGLLVLVGVVLPTIVNQWRARSAAGAKPDA